MQIPFPKTDRSIRNYICKETTKLTLKKERGKKRGEKKENFARITENRELFRCAYASDEIGISRIYI